MKEAGGGAGKTGRDWDPPPHTPGVSPCRPGSPSGIPPLLTSLPPAPPAVADAPFTSRHNRPTFGDPPYVSAPKRRVLARPSRSGPPAARE